MHGQLQHNRPCMKNACLPSDTDRAVNSDTMRTYNDCRGRRHVHDMDLAFGRRCAMHMSGNRGVSRMFRCLANGLLLVMTAITRDFPGYLAFSVMVCRMMRALVISATMPMIMPIVACRGGAGGSQHYQCQSQLTKRFHLFSPCAN